MSVIVKKGQSIVLTPYDLLEGAHTGLQRRIDSITRGFAERRGLKREQIALAWYINLVGAMGEMAWAILSGCIWPRIVNSKKTDPDVLPDWQVRTLAEPWYDLLVRPDDPNHFRYVLMTGDPPEFTFRGWIDGLSAKTTNPDWFCDKGNRNEPGYWVPQISLKDFIPETGPQKPNLHLNNGRADDADRFPRYSQGASKATSPLASPHRSSPSGPECGPELPSDNRETPRPRACTATGIRPSNSMRTNPDLP